MSLKMRGGFTLAEVLITLAIIGVVAALTTPSVIRNSQNAKIGPTLAKICTTIETAIQAACNDQEKLLQIVEIPIPFISHFRVWEGKSGYVQPGMVFVGERCMGTQLYTFYNFLHKERLTKLREEKFNYSMNMHSSFWAMDSVTKEKIRVQDLSRVFTEPLFQGERYYQEVNPFLNQIGVKQRVSIKKSFNLLNSSSLFFEPNVRIVSDRYKMIDLILKNVIT